MYSLIHLGREYDRRGNNRESSKSGNRMEQLAAARSSTERKQQHTHTGREAAAWCTCGETTSRKIMARGEANDHHMLRRRYASACGHLTLGSCGRRQRLGALPASNIGATGELGPSANLRAGIRQEIEKLGRRDGWSATCTQIWSFLPARDDSEFFATPHSAALHPNNLEKQPSRPQSAS